MPNPWEIYDFLIEQARATDTAARVKQVLIGLTWTLCQTTAQKGTSIGLAMSPGQYTRTLSWSGTLVDRPAVELAEWVKHWDPFQASIGLAALNALINASAETPVAKAVPIPTTGSPNLAVFEYFLPKLKHKKVVVIGRYPGLENLETALDITVLERNPCAGDLPDPACEYVLPEADWVFMTASSIANKTFPRLSELSRNAVTVLIGPSVPWIDRWRDFGIDFLAGIQINHPDRLQATIAEGGGVRIFDEAVSYHVLDLSHSALNSLKNDIAHLVAQREQLKAEMDTWYKQTSGTKHQRFPKWALLEQTDRRLSALDLRYKRQWDARDIS